MPQGLEVSGRSNFRSKRDIGVTVVSVQTTVGVQERYYTLTQYLALLATLTLCQELWNNMQPEPKKVHKLME